MQKYFAAVIIAFIFYTNTCAQVLFTYGKTGVEAKEFLRAFNKNNTPAPANRAKAIRDYLNLYIASRLKISEAYARGYDTLPQQREELQNLRAQIIETYLNDSKGLERLVTEAFQRSQKDVRLAHIFVGFANEAGLNDTAAAGKKIGQAYKALQSGENFSAVAKRFSEDPSVQQNNGEIGYITVFTLPYELENIAYKTAPGKFSAIYRSRSGYHILKNLGERKAIGRIRAAQILLAFPPDLDEPAKKQLKLRADSLHRLLMNGEDFGKLAKEFSNDYVSAASGGMIQEFGIGLFEPVFENTVLSLEVNGVSRPFETPHGIHIVKLLGRKPIPASQSDKEFLYVLRGRVQGNERMATLEEIMLQKAKKQVGFRQHAYPQAELWLYSDSVLDYKRPNFSFKIGKQTPLFSVGDTTMTVDDWIYYAHAFRFKTDGTGNKPHEQVMNEFVRTRVMQHYRDNLEKFNPDFRYQLQEFKDGNLFFEIMQREVWGKMQSDTAALLALYEKNRSKYIWKQSADAIIFFNNDQSTAQLMAEKIKSDPANWRAISEAMAEKVAADSGRYEWNQLPGIGKLKPKPGMITTAVKGTDDGSVSFAYIINVYTQPSPRSFEQAKALVINDYQEELEKKWMTELTRKYPVKINESVLREIAMK